MRPTRVWDLEGSVHIAWLVIQFWDLKSSDWSFHSCLAGSHLANEVCESSLWQHWAVWYLQKITSNSFADFQLRKYIKLARNFQLKRAIKLVYSARCKRGTPPVSHTVSLLCLQKEQCGVTLMSQSDGFWGLFYLIFFTVHGECNSAILNR